MKSFNFTNASPTDFSIRENRDLFRSEIERFRNENYGKIVAYPIINGEKIKTDIIEKSIDPSSEEELGQVHFAGESHVQDAMQSLIKAKDKWRKTSWKKRADILKKTADIMHERKLELAALIIHEAGKAWKEADADVDEAIDFCIYYAQLAEEMGTPKLTQKVLGEENYYSYFPRGIALVISPWNFPLAIACGMTVAALVTGNCTILKPAEQTSLIAGVFAEILLEAGLPKDVFALLPGKGELIGRNLVKHPNVDIICFTGSKPVGLEILKTASEVLPGQTKLKKIICELGGKNAIIVDEDADLDEAIKGILYSAFGFSGQKCSACSRVIAVGDAYERLIERLAKAAKDIIIGEAYKPETFVGPVIDHEAFQRIQKTILNAEEKHELVCKGDAPRKGFFVPQTVFRDVSEDSELWNEEVFGPVVACAQAESFANAIKMANKSQYALTGGVFSRSPNNIALAKAEFEVGNLYINRSCTGAIVCRQPFGGFKMSGIGSKAGGPDYLLQFVEPRVHTENTMRRGFSPDLA
ncbi:MAG: L-glutamate gamma-semialdehyde dehydrogenase [Bdellovibrionales bacterium]|nr:L-glutamate gamma-semialdehyde dehydrogenase [Bdellovibrionales bacterium]